MQFVMIRNVFEKTFIYPISSIVSVTEITMREVVSSIEIQLGEGKTTHISVQQNIDQIFDLLKTGQSFELTFKQ